MPCRAVRNKRGASLAILRLTVNTTEKSHATSTVSPSSCQDCSDQDRRDHLSECSGRRPLPARPKESAPCPFCGHPPCRTTSVRTGACSYWQGGCPQKGHGADSLGRAG